MDDIGGEIRAWWSSTWPRAREELAVLDLKVSLELEQARHELGELARACWDTVERDVLHRTE